MHRFVAAVAALVVVASAGGCSVGSVRRGTPQPTTSPTASPGAPAGSAPAGATVEVLAADVPVPRGYEQHIVEFVAANLGYALFTRCVEGGCNAILLATFDGGHSWDRLEHPAYFAENHQLYADFGTVVLLAEPQGWYVSKDFGRSFTTLPLGAVPPPVVWGLGGGFKLCCDSDPAELVEWRAGQKRPVPTRAPVPHLGATGFDGRTLHAAGLKDGRPYAAASDDRGRTWREVFVGGGEGLAGVRILVARGENPDVWLIGEIDRFEFPLIWHFDGTGWRPAGAVGHPDRYASMAPIGGGLLAVTGPAGSGFVDGGAYRVGDWPVAHGHLHVLGDGTVVGQVDSELYLGVGPGEKRRWMKVVLNTV